MRWKLRVKKQGRWWLTKASRPEGQLKHCLERKTLPSYLLEGIHELRGYPRATEGTRFLVWMRITVPTHPAEREMFHQCLHEAGIELVDQVPKEIAS
jgi:hypothetical protein